MPIASEARTAFPVLRRGRRLSLRPQGSDTCTSQPRTTTATASNTEQPLQHQIRTAPSKSSFHHGQVHTTTTITSTSQPVAQDETAEESQPQASSSPSSSTATTPQRRKRRSLLSNPHLKVAAAKLKLPRKAPPTPQSGTINSNSLASASPDFEEQDLECPICQDPVGVPNPEGRTEIWGQLHCGHRFGQQCILTWILDSLTQNGAVNPCCPMCREEICHPCGHPLLQIASSHGRGGDDDDTTDEDAEERDGYELTRENEANDGNEPETRRERALAGIAQMRHRVAGMAGAQRVRGGLRRVSSSTAVHNSAAILCFLADVMVLVFKSMRIPRLKLLIASPKSKRNEVALVPPAGYCRMCRDEMQE